MAIQNRNLEAGTVLKARYKGQVYTCEVTRSEGGLRYCLEDGREFKSPSSAGQAIAGHAINGWVFWTRINEFRHDAQARAAKKARQAKARKREGPEALGCGTTALSETPGIGRMTIRRNRDGKVAGKERAFYCEVCGEIVASTEQEAMQHVAEAHPQPVEATA